MTLLRAFIAVEIPLPIRQAIFTQTESLRATLGPLVRWVPIENMHLTLKFIGDVSPANAELLTQMLTAETTFRAPDGRTRFLPDPSTRLRTSLAAGARDLDRDPGSGRVREPATRHRICFGAAGLRNGGAPLLAAPDDWPRSATGQRERSATSPRGARADAGRRARRGRGDSRPSVQKRFETDWFGVHAAVLRAAKIVTRHLYRPTTNSDINVAVH
jgi:hypothetical protein